MSDLLDRMKSFEKKYALDAEKAFKLEARACKKLGLAIAAKLGKIGPDADAYAMDVVTSNLEEAGFNDVIRKVRADLDAANLQDIDNAKLEAMLVTHMEEAAKELASAA